MKSEEKELIEVFVNFVNDYKGEDIHIPDYLKDVFFSINSNEPSEPEADGCNKQAKEFAEKLISNQKDIDPEYVDIVNEHWNELLAND